MCRLTLMKFGLHYQLSCGRDQSPMRRYADTIAQAVYGERLGFESVWPAEPHFAPESSIRPSPLLLLSAIAARTSTLRLGTGVVLLPLAHPLRVAEEFATLDVVSAGRAECGIGRGMDPIHFVGNGGAASASAARLEEGVDLLRQAFTGTKFSFAGRYHQIDNAVLAPAPIQRPHPPIRLAANSTETMRLAGRLGLPILVGLHVNTLTGLRDMLPAYREAQREARVARQPDDITVLAPVFTAASTDEIRRAVTPGVMFLKAALENKIGTRTAALATGPETEAERARLERIARDVHALDFDSMADGRAIFDTPDGCLDRLRQLQTVLGAGRVVGWFNIGGLLPHRCVLSAMESFAINVMPRTSRALQFVK
jgi:alkanesulfonate monooxygenase SsuD/methylene tetrahydromethanopterin reductase-like flavin-dependent oxidoreductase (luciferase family)